MTLQDILTIALDFAYLATLVVAIGEYQRRREPVGLAVVAVFTAVFVVFAASTVGLFFPALGTLSAFAAFAAFLALPVLALLHVLDDVRIAMQHAVAEFGQVCDLTRAMFEKRRTRGSRQRM